MVRSAVEMLDLFENNIGDTIMKSVLEGDGGYIVFPNCEEDSPVVTGASKEILERIRLQIAQQ